jgi:hypothetical protein
MDSKNDSTQNTELLSVGQIKALERIANENHTTPARLVTLAVDALIVEAARNDDWLPLPKTSGQ